ncbi:hypothetical protein [Candidatus Deianiraea vastatrix]|nr:hypothetical protein [Candidatus Deianiraea vastatrix]
MKTYGCQMNVYDSERMHDMMNAIGYEVFDDYKGAEIIRIKKP